MAKRRSASAAKPSSKNGGLLLVVILLFVALALLIILYYRQTPQAQSPPATTESAELISDDHIVYGGIPRAGRPGIHFEVLKNRAYMVGYSEDRKDPLWTAYRVFNIPNPFDLPRPTGRFLTDTRTAAAVKDGDFVRSGYDRGHMAPNSAIARCYGPEAQIETFLLTNICPQSPALNEKVWERLEVAERRYAMHVEELWVIDGPVFADLNGGKTDRLASGVSVPSAFYKILVDEEGAPGGHPRVFSVIMPQDVKGTELPQQFLTSVHEVEKQTGLDFLWKLDDATEQPLENGVWSMWP